MKKFFLQIKYIIVPLCFFLISSIVLGISYSIISMKINLLFSELYILISDIIIQIIIFFVTKKLCMLKCSNWIDVIINSIIMMISAVVFVGAVMYTNALLYSFLMKIFN